jgi:glycosyltransferase involved in cell wall biosynthesis
MPPPAGGISIHLERLSGLMRDTYEVDWIDESSVNKKNYFNIRSLNAFTYFGKLYSADLVFIHSGNRFFKKLHLLFGRLFFKKIIMTIHGYGPRRIFISRKIDEWFFNMAHHIILVNEGIYQKLSISKNKSSVHHAFLPPLMADEPALPAFLTSKIAAAKAINSVVICANASSLDSYEGKDLYGLDNCIELAEALRKQQQSFLLIFNVTSIHVGKERYEWAKQRVEALHLEDCLLLMNESISFVKLMEVADIMLRPTLTDGDSLSVREALFLGKTVIASDVVTRPEGVVLYKNDDTADLLMKMVTLIRHPNKGGKNELTNNKQEDAFAFYDALFQKMLNII